MGRSNNTNQAGGSGIRDDGKRDVEFQFRAARRQWNQAQAYENDRNNSNDQPAVEPETAQGKQNPRDLQGSNGGLEGTCRDFDERLTRLERAMGSLLSEIQSLRSELSMGERKSNNPNQ